MSKTVTTSFRPIELKELFNCSRVNSGSNIGIYFNNINEELCHWFEPKFFNTRCGTFSCNARCFQLCMFLLSSFNAIFPSTSVSSLSTRLATTLSALMTPPKVCDEKAGYFCYLIINIITIIAGKSIHGIGHLVIFLFQIRKMNQDQFHENLHDVAKDEEDASKPVA